jgi:hypothetical protein
VIGILDRLGPGFEVVPLDVFLKLAAASPDFQPRFAHPERPRTGPLNAQ